MKNRLQGITLIETVLYIGLFSVIILLVLNFMLATQESTLVNNRKNEIYKTSEFIVQHINYSFDHALSIEEEPLQTNILQLQFTDGNKQYYVSDSTLYYDLVPLTPPDILVSQFTLEPFYNEDPYPIAVRINIDIQSKSDSKYSDTINLLSTLK